MSTSRTSRSTRSSLKKCNEPINYDVCTKDFEDDNILKSIDKKLQVKFTKIPESHCLYQGTDFAFLHLPKQNSDSALETKKSNPTHFSRDTEFIYKIDNIKAQENSFYDYYDKRNSGAYFVSSYSVANIYGLDKRYSPIVYASLPDLNDIKNPSNKIKYIYPLYYINKQFFTITYETTKELFLLDIGDINTVRLIWLILHFNPSGLSPCEISDFKYSLFNSCANDGGEADTDADVPQFCKRVSDASDDSVLIKIFKLLERYFNSKGISVDGWIYNGPDFHKEICILDRNNLKIKEIHTRKLTIPKGIPTYEDYREQIKGNLIKYKSKSKMNNILHNYIIPNPDI
jgi:hypothetical protein